MSDMPSDRKVTEEVISEKNAMEEESSTCRS